MNFHKILILDSFTVQGKAVPTLSILGTSLCLIWFRSRLFLQLWSNRDTGFIYWTEKMPIDADGKGQKDRGCSK